MKIFFLPKKRTGIFTTGSLGNFLLIALVMSLIGAQSVRFKEETAKSVSSPEVTAIPGEIMLFTSPLEKNDEVWILVDGEKKAKVTDNRASVIIDTVSTIEVMSYSEKEFTLNLVLASNIEAVGNCENIKCKKGINYISRCIVS